MWSDKARKLASQKNKNISAKKLILRINEYKTSPSLCSNCNIELEYKKRKNKFCSKSCSVSSNNRGKPSKNTIHGRYKQKKCLNCENSTKLKFCSKKCYMEYTKNKRRDKINALGGLINCYNRDKWYLIETKGYKCEVCQLSEWMCQEIPLDIDHIDGNSDNNSLDNLRLICPNCHRQTPTYGSKNSGNGRYTKRKLCRTKRYLEGKSY